MPNCLEVIHGITKGYLVPKVKVDSWRKRKLQKSIQTRNSLLSYFQIVLVEIRSNNDSYAEEKFHCDIKLGGDVYFDILQSYDLLFNATMFEILWWNTLTMLKFHVETASPNDSSNVLTLTSSADTAGTVVHKAES